MDINIITCFRIKNLSTELEELRKVLNSTTNARRSESEQLTKVTQDCERYKRMGDMQRSSLIALRSVAKKSEELEKELNALRKQHEVRITVLFHFKNDSRAGIPEHKKPWSVLMWIIGYCKRFDVTVVFCLNYHSFILSLDYLAPRKVEKVLIMTNRYMGVLLVKSSLKPILPDVVFLYFDGTLCF